MSDPVSLLELRTRAQQLSDTENDPNISVPEWNALANRHVKRVYGLLVEAGPADFYAATTTVLTVNGLSPNPLEANFRNLIAVYVIEPNERRRPIDPVRELARGNYKAPTGTWLVEIEYIPVPDALEDDGDTFDAVAGWDELIVNLMARDAMIKRESDPSVVLGNIASETARIREEARKRDRRPKRIADLDDRASTVWPYVDTSGSRISAYRLRAGNLELFEPFWGYP